MGYYKRINGEINFFEDEELPKETESDFQNIRDRYSVEYDVTDWADDDTDSGMGYCYDNSFSIYREPYRKELIIEDGKLWGFCFYSGYNELIYISLEGEKRSYTKFGHNTSRYGHVTTWTLIEEEPPLKAKYVYAVIDEPDKNKNFTAADFPEGTVKACVKKIGIEDGRGHYDKRSRIWLELTDEAAGNIDETLLKLKTIDKIKSAVPAKKYRKGQ